MTLVTDHKLTSHDCKCAVPLTSHAASAEPLARIQGEAANLRICLRGFS